MQLIQEDFINLSGIVLNPYGVVVDGNTLVVSTYYHSEVGGGGELFVLDRQTGNTLDKFDISSFNESARDITFDGNSYWMINYPLHLIQQVNRKGELLNQIDLTGIVPVPNPADTTGAKGIAFLGNHLMVGEFSLLADELLYIIGRDGLLKETLSHYVTGNGYQAFGIAHDGNNVVIINDINSTFSIVSIDRYKLVPMDIGFLAYSFGGLACDGGLYYLVESADPNAGGTPGIHVLRITK